MENMKNLVVTMVKELEKNFTQVELVNVDFTTNEITFEVEGKEVKVFATLNMTLFIEAVKAQMNTVVFEGKEYFMVETNGKKFAITAKGAVYHYWESWVKDTKLFKVSPSKTPKAVREFVANMGMELA